MNETERDRILELVADGTLRPREAAQLLAALAGPPAPNTAGAAKTANLAKPATQASQESKENSKKQPLAEVELQRPDGTKYKLQVPPELVPMFWEFTKVAVRESVRSAAHDTWYGMKAIVKNTTKEMKTNFTEYMSAPKKKEEALAILSMEQSRHAEARRTILQMVQNGRINADDAGRLILQLDAHLAFQKSHPATLPAAVK